MASETMPCAKIVYSILSAKRGRAVAGCVGVSTGTPSRTKFRSEGKSYFFLFLKVGQVTSLANTLAKRRKESRSLGEREFGRDGFGGDRHLVSAL